MEAAALVLFWIGIVTPALVYVGYPAAVAFVARWRALPPPAEASAWPTVTITIAAHDEERDIARAIRNLLGQEYPGLAPAILVGLDGCTDGTREVIEAMSEPRVTYLDLPRAGKAATDNALAARATTEVVVTTASGAEFDPATLRRLVAPFRDPAVGCVSGVFAPRQDGSEAAAGEGLYWRFEYGLMEGESRLGLLAAASGTSMAYRRSAFRPIPAGSDGDVAIAPAVALQGLRVVFVRDAVVRDDGPPDFTTVLRARRRMALRALPTTVHFIAALLRAGRWGPAIGLTFHKLLRWLVPWCVPAWIVGAAILVARGEPLYIGLTVAVLVGVAAVLAGLIVGGARARGAAIGFTLAQLAFAAALIDALRGRQARMWTRR